MRGVRAQELMSTKRLHFGIALAVGFALALLTKFIYDLFNGYSAVENYLTREGIRASAGAIEIFGVIALVIPAFIVGRVLVSSLSSAPARLALACAIPWVALTLYGFVAGLLRTNSQRQMGIIFSSVLAALGPLLTILSVPAGLWLAVKSKRRRNAVAL